MTRARRAAVLVLFAPLVGACSASASPGFFRDTGNGEPDSGVIAPRFDGGGSVDAGARPDGPFGVAPDGGPESDRNDPGLYAAACLDGRDLDCANPSCAFAASCCVGVASTACCTIAGMPIQAVFQCGVGTCDTLDRFTTFGAPGPTPTSDQAYAPASDLENTDSGGIFVDPIDPRAAMIAIHARLGVPMATPNVDAIGVGLVTGGASAHVVPLAAVVVSAARREVLLLLGDTVAGAFAAPTDGAMHDYTLTIDPSGNVHAGDATQTLSATIPLPSAPVHAAFFGRATTPTATTTDLPARIGSFTVTTSGCDQPTALTRMGAITIVDHTGAALLSTAADPSVAVDGVNVWLAFAARSMVDPTHGSIFLALRESDGAFHVRAPTGGTQPVLTPAPGESLESPALVVGTGSWTLFATRVHGGVRSLVQAQVTGPSTFGPLTDIATPDLVGDVSSPAPIPNDPTRLVARFAAAASAAGPELVLLGLTASGASATPSVGLCGADSSCTGGARTEQHVYASRTGTIAFDADDVDDPAVVFYDHVYRLYYAGRLGSRWGIGMAIAADIGYWRPANGGLPVLGPQGTDFDAVSVRAPSPVVESNALSLYYVGSDGDASAIGLVQGGAVVP